MLLAGSIAVLVLVLGAAAWIGYDAGEDEADELFDARLATSARVLAALYATQPPQPAAESPIVVSFPGPLAEAAHDEPGPLGHHYETKIAFQVRSAKPGMIVKPLHDLSQHSLLQIGGVRLTRADERRHEVVQPEWQGRLANLPWT